MNPQRRKTMMTIYAPKLLASITNTIQKFYAEVLLIPVNWETKKHFPTEFQLSLQSIDEYDSTYDNWKKSCELKLLQNIRFSRDRQFQKLSYITLGNGQDVEEMIYLISAISRNNAFITNITSTRLAKHEIRYETPEWLQRKLNFTLGEFIAALFEGALYIRLNNESLRPKENFSMRKENLDCESFWFSLNENEKEKIFANALSNGLSVMSITPSLVQIYIMIRKAAFDTKRNRFIEYITLLPLVHFGSELFILSNFIFESVAKFQRDKIYSELTHYSINANDLINEKYIKLVQKANGEHLDDYHAQLYQQCFESKNSEIAQTSITIKRKRKKRANIKKEAESNSTNEGSEQIISNEESLPDLHSIFDNEIEEEDFDPTVITSKIVSSIMEFCNYEHKNFVKSNKVLFTNTENTRKPLFRPSNKKVINHQYEEAVKMFSELTGVKSKFETKLNKKKKEDKKKKQKQISQSSQMSIPKQQYNSVPISHHESKRIYDDQNDEFIRMISEGYKLLKPLPYSILSINHSNGLDHLESDITKFIFNIDRYMGKLDSFRIYCFHLLQKAIFDFYDGKYNIQAHVFGSVATGLALESSDMDIAVSGIPIYSHEQLLDEFRKIKPYLEAITQIKSVKPIFTAKVPILKLMMQGDIFPAIKIDLLIPEESDDMPSHLPRCLNSVTMTKDVLNKFKYTREVVILLKKLLNIRNYNSPYTGIIIIRRTFFVCISVDGGYIY